MRFKVIDRYPNRAIQIGVLTIYSFIGTAIVLGALCVLDTEYFLEFLSSIETEGTSEEPFDYFFWGMAITIMPLLETLVFQFAFLKWIKNSTEFIFDSESWRPAFLITSIAFAAFHVVLADSYANAHWFILPRLPGSIAFAMIAITEFQRRDGHPIIVTTIAHACFNLFLLLIIGVLYFFSTLHLWITG